MLHKKSSQISQVSVRGGDHESLMQHLCAEVDRKAEVTDTHNNTPSFEIEELGVNRWRLLLVPYDAYEPSLGGHARSCPSRPIKGWAKQPN